jgi:hypothetical protein
MKERNNMKVKFRFDIGTIHRSEIKEVQSTATDDDIKSLFPIVLGMNYHTLCSWEILEEGD